MDDVRSGRNTLNNVVLYTDDLDPRIQHLCPRLLPTSARVDAADTLFNHICIPPRALRLCTVDGAEPDAIIPSKPNEVNIGYTLLLQNIFQPTLALSQRRIFQRRPERGVHFHPWVSALPQDQIHFPDVQLFDQLVARCSYNTVIRP